MDIITKKCVLQIIGNHGEAEDILQEMGVLREKAGDEEEEAFELEQFLHRKRILWLHGKRIYGRSLVSMYEVYGRDGKKLCQAIDSQRREAEVQNWTKAVQRLASNLSNDETPVKQRLLALHECFDSMRDMYNFLQLFTKMGFGAGFKEALQFSSPAGFVDWSYEAYRKYSTREQHYRNARLCADTILEVRRIKSSTLLHMKQLLKEKLAPLDALHDRAVILYNLMQWEWEGPLLQHIEHLYNEPHQLTDWSEFLLQPPTLHHLCCYLLLCKPDVIQRIKIFLSVLNQQQQ